ncbi:MAG: oligopeptide/dipeptide ABC transporter ATP-binding protein [Clostridium sp.]
MNIIEYKNFSLSFKDKKVVDNISFEVEEGKVIGILGESGSGKTVTAMSLVNLILEEKKTEGEILFLGENLLNIKEEEMEKIRGEKISDKVLLEVNNLSKEYIKEKSFFGKKKKVLKAVNDVSFKLYEGETLGIVGESGCGKSTIAKLLVRLLEKDSGEVIIDNKDIFSLKGKELRELRRDIQMIFQDPYSSLDPMMKIEKIMEEGILQNNIKSKIQSEEYIKEILKDCSIHEESLLKYPKEFSGGQRQRICIGRAISLNPKIIIGDEPISSLDVSTQEEIGKLLVKLQEEKGISYIFISHDLSVVRRISHRVIVMYLGEIVEEGLTKEIYENPKHPYTKALMESIPISDPRLRGKKEILEGEIPISVENFEGCPFYNRCAQRLEKCGKNKPKLIGQKESKVSCFLFQN